MATKLLSYADLTDAKLGKDNGFFPDAKEVLSHDLDNMTQEQFRSLGTKRKDSWIEQMGDNTLTDLATKARNMDMLQPGKLGDYREIVTEFANRIAHDHLIGVKVGNETGIAFKGKNSGNIASLATSTVNFATEGGNNVLAEPSMGAAVFDQVTPSNVSPINQVFPEVNYPTIAVRAVQFDPIRGILNQRDWGQPFKEIQKRGYIIKTIKGRPASNQIRISQEEGIGLRDPGSDVLSQSGIALILAKMMQQFPVMKQTYMVNDTYSAIFTGWASTNTNKSLNYNIPAKNRLTASTLGGGGAFLSFDANKNIIPGTGKVLLALANLATNVLRRYLAYQITFFMTSQTLAGIVRNASIDPVQNLSIGYNLASGKVKTHEETFATIWETFGGISKNISVVTDDSQYIADYNDPNGYAFDAINYLLPQGQIFIAISGLEAGLGQYIYTPVPQRGGVIAPQGGVAYWMVDTLASNTVQGTQNPELVYNINLVSIPLIYRNLDVFTLDATQ